MAVLPVTSYQIMMSVNQNHLSHLAISQEPVGTRIDKELSYIPQ